MKKLILSAILILSVQAAYGQTATKSGWTAPGGLNTSMPGHMIPENDFTDLGDVFTDKGAYVEKRGGLNQYYSINKNYPIKQLYENIKLDGKRYGIVKSSGELGYIDTSDNYNVLITTLPVNARLWMVQYNNDCYIGTSDKTDRWRFDGTYLYVSTYIPCSKYPLIYMDKMFAIAITTPMTNDAAITTSGDESVLRYSRIGDLKGWDGDFWIGVNRNDGDVITGAFIYRGNLYVTKSKSVSQILRVDNEDNTDGERAVPVLANVGCIAQDTIKEINGLMYWVSEDGVVEFDGTSYKIISEDVKDDIENIVAEANSGISTGSRFTDTTNSDYSLGTLTNIENGKVNGSIIVSSDVSTLTIQQQNTVWNDENDLTPSSILERYQTFQTSYTVYLSTVIAYIRLDGIGPTRINGRVINGKTGTTAGYTEVTLKAGVTTYAFNFQSSEMLLETGYSHKFGLTVSSGTSGTTAYWKYSTNNPYSGGTADGNASNDYFFKLYCYGFNKFGQFQSQTHTVLTGFAQWGVLEANFNPLTAGKTTTGVKFFVSASSTTNFIGTSWLHPMATGYVINLTSNPYICFIASMTSTDPYVCPEITDVSINFYYKDPQYMMGAYGEKKDMRYWIAGTKSPSLINNVVYVYQVKTGKWTKLNMNAGAMADFKGNFLIGTSTDSGKIYRYSTDYSNDGGIAFHPYVRTKDYVLSTRLTDNRFDSLWVYAEPSTVYSTMTVNYFPNLKNNAWSITSGIGLTADTNYTDMYIRAKIRQPTLDRIRTIGFKFTDFDKLDGFDFLYVPLPPGER